MTSDEPEQPKTNEGDGPKIPKKRGRLYLRKARRKARVLGLISDSDEHAARLLEERGIDVMKDEVSILSQSQAEGGSGSDNSGEMSEAKRVTEVYKIQLSLVRRRRLRLFLLVMRLSFFVLLPTFFVGRYYYTQATEMYETRSEFVIQKSESASSSIGSLFSGTGFANSADSITVQGYLTSREAMIRLDKDLGYRAHFQQEHIDDIQRLTEDASLEDAYSLFRKNVKVGYDPAEGVIRLEVVASTPEDSRAFSLALIAYAEERVDQLSQRVREDQMKGSKATYAEAEAAMLSAQDRVLELQQERGIMSAEAEIASRMGIINSLEMQIEDRRMSLAEILDNPSPNTVRAGVIEREIERLATRVGELRQEMTETTNSNLSLAAISAELSIAQANLLTRQGMMTQALIQLETARISANKQVRYLSIGVSPVAPDVPTHPRKFENTVLAFIIFMVIYLMTSLTISILREQVSV